MIERKKRGTKKKKTIPTSLRHSACKQTTPFEGHGKQRQRDDIIIIQAQGIKPVGAEFYGMFYIVAVVISLTEGRRVYGTVHTRRGVVSYMTAIRILSPRLISALDYLLI